MTPEQALTTVPQGTAALIELAMLKARSYITKSKADNTVRGYRADFAHFTAWCESTGVMTLPAVPATVAMYMADLASTAKVSRSRGDWQQSVRRTRPWVTNLHVPCGMRPYRRC